MKEDYRGGGLEQNSGVVYFEFVFVAFNESKAKVVERPPCVPEKFMEACRSLLKKPAATEELRPPG